MIGEGHREARPSTATDITAAHVRAAGYRPEPLLPTQQMVPGYGLVDMADPTQAVGARVYAEACLLRHRPEGGRLHLKSAPPFVERGNLRCHLCKNPHPCAYCRWAAGVIDGV